MYKQLTSEQRYTISVLLQRKCSKKSIAEAIGVHPSTITRELKRNSSQRGVYKWDWAQKHADKRSRRQPGNRAIGKAVWDEVRRHGITGNHGDRFLILPAINEDLYPLII